MLHKICISVCLDYISEVKEAKFRGKDEIWLVIHGNKQANALK
ncbi:MAG: hypothetical protein QXK17_04620 [Metallosphaera sp.]